MSESLTHYTQDHDEIREWAQAREAVPSHVTSTGSRSTGSKSTGSKKDAGLIRLDFPSYSGAGSLEEISWDEWFEKFDKSGLALIYQEHTASGEPSNFNKLIAHDPEEAGKHSKKAKTHSAKTHSAKN